MSEIRTPNLKRINRKYKRIQTCLGNDGVFARIDSGYEDVDDRKRYIEWLDIGSYLLKPREGNTEGFLLSSNH
jgi:hypothetical protein